MHLQTLDSTPQCKRSEWRRFIYIFTWTLSQPTLLCSVECYYDYYCHVWGYQLFWCEALEKISQFPQWMLRFFNNEELVALATKMHRIFQMIRIQVRVAAGSPAYTMQMRRFILPLELFISVPWLYVVYILCNLCFLMTLITQKTPLELYRKRYTLAKPKKPY